MKTIVGLLLILIQIAGCALPKNPPVIINNYTLSYPSPSFGDLPSIENTVKLDRLSVAQASNTSDVLYSPAQFTLEKYADSRWIANPGDLVTDYLLRDLRDSNLFQAVFSYQDCGGAQYGLQGGVESFLQIDSENTRAAVLKVNITLLDLECRNVPSRVVFQKNYFFTQSMTEQTPYGLSKAMSHNMSDFSKTLILDVYAELRARSVSTRKSDEVKAVKSRSAPRRKRTE